jgi:hypothetical protein
MYLELDRYDVTFSSVQMQLVTIANRVKMKLAVRQNGETWRTEVEHDKLIKKIVENSVWET